MEVDAWKSVGDRRIRENKQWVGDKHNVFVSFGTNEQYGRMYDISVRLISVV
jgi:hypothetical protein